MEKLRAKYKAAESEISDLTHEHQQQKTELLDIIRSQEKAVKFSNKVMNILFTENELYKLHNKSKWDEERGDWAIPLFTFNPKNKDISFPSINAKSRVEQSKDEREINIQEEEDDKVPDDQFRKQGNFTSKKTGKKNKSDSRNDKQEKIKSVGNKNGYTNNVYN